MANKPLIPDIDTPFRLEDHPYGPPLIGESEAPSWTDGLPHDFRGWGPQTPDTDALGGDGVSAQPDGALTWDGEDDAQDHHVWRFDGRRRQHH